MSATNRGSERRACDFYETPAWCVQSLLAGIDLPGGTWLEPCAGNGAIISAVDQVRRDIEWSAVDIMPTPLGVIRAKWPDVQVQAADILTQEIEQDQYDVIVTNPPFSAWFEIARHLVGRAEHTIMLLRLNALASIKRCSWWQAHPPDVLVLPRRPSFTGRGTDATEYAWFHWPGRAREDGTVRVLDVHPRGN